MSYTPLKTINGNSIKGTGDLVVSGSGVSDGDKGDITVSGSGTVWEIDAATVGVTELSATGTPSATTFLRGDNTWAAPTSADPAGWTTIVKSANQDVTNSTTLVDDTDLQFSVVAGGHYMVEANICYSGNNTTGDYKFALALSAGLMKARGLGNMYLSTGTPSLQAITANNTISSGNNLGVLFNDLDELHTFTFTYNFYADTNATFKYQFANRVASPGYISRTWKGSILKYKRID
jgi:hypothetical protein